MDDFTPGVGRTHGRVHRRFLAREITRRRWLRITGLVVGVLIGIAAFPLFARNTYQVGPAQVSATARWWTRGETVLALPPIGSVAANTHAAPVVLQVRLDNVDLPELQRLVQGGVPDSAELRRLRERLVSGMEQAGARGFAAAVAVAAFIAWSLSRSGRYTALAAAVTAVLVGGVIGWAILGYDQSAFRQPRYEGTLAYAPGVVQIVQQRAREVQKLETEIGGIARDLANYYARPQTFASGGSLPGTYRVLHETDIHLDPVGLRLSRELARSFDVGFIIDTGDINNLGTFPEGLAVVKGLDTSLPRLFVGGNHDTPQILSAIAKLKNVTVLDQTAATVGGIRVFGVSDPVGRGLVPDATPAPAVAAQIASNALASLKGGIASGEATPDIVAVHQPSMVPPFLGIAPVVLDGHTHTPAVEHLMGTWVINSGTTGGVTFRGLQSDPHIPHTATILYYTLAMPRRLVAFDTVQVFGKVTQTSLTRTVVDESLLPSASVVPSQSLPATRSP